MRSGLCTALRRQQGLLSGARCLYNETCCTPPVQLLTCEVMCPVNSAGYPHIWLVDVLCLQVEGCGGRPLPSCSPAFVAVRFAGTFLRNVALILQDPVIREISKKYNRITHEIIIRWGIQHGTSVLVKSGTPKHIKVHWLPIRLRHPIL